MGIFHFPVFNTVSENYAVVAVDERTKKANEIRFSLSGGCAKARARGIMLEKHDFMIRVYE